MVPSPSSILNSTGKQFQSIGTSFVTNASTMRKIAMLRASGKGGIADAAEKFLGLPSTSPTKSTETKDLDKYTKSAIQTLFAAELKIHENLQTATSTATTGIAKANAKIAEDIRGIKDDLHEALKPVSSATGQVLANMTGVLRDPLGAPEAIGKSLSHLVDKVNPGFTDRLEATLKKYKTDDLQHLGTNILGGIRSLASTIDAILSVPLSIAADIYNGLMEIMKEISNLIDSIVSGVMDLIFGPKGLLDSLLPMGDLLDFLSAVSEIAGIVGSIGGSFTGISAVTGAVSQIGSFSSLGAGVLSNPASLASSFMPPGVSQYSAALRNPQQMLSNLIPPQIQQQLGKVGSLPGLGYVGNFGYGIGSTLDSIKGGVLTGIVDKFSSQLGVIGNQLGKPSPNKPYTDQTTTHPAAITGASTNPKIPVNANHGTPVDTTPPKPIFSDRTSNPIQAATVSPASSLLNPSNETFNYNKPPTPDASYLYNK